MNLAIRIGRLAFSFGASAYVVDPAPLADEAPYPLAETPDTPGTPAPVGFTARPTTGRA